VDPPASDDPGAGEPPTVAQSASAQPLQGDALPTDALPTDTAPPWAPESQSSGPATVINDRPEIAVGAAFAGGLVFALILKRLAR
jgi:hypothetical protein